MPKKNYERKSICTDIVDKKTIGTKKKKNSTAKTKGHEKFSFCGFLLA